MPTEPEARQEYAVWGRSIVKNYGGGKRKFQVLQNLDITVQRGCMYDHYQYFIRKKQKSSASCM